MNQSLKNLPSLFDIEIYVRPHIPPSPGWFWADEYLMPSAVPTERVVMSPECLEKLRKACKPQPKLPARRNGTWTQR
jgi:hypothetical protein